MQQCLFKEFKDVFAQTYKDLQGIPLELVQDKIKLDTSISPTHQTRYKLNLNYGVIVKQDIDKLLIIGFIQPIEEATWLSPTMVIPKKNGKLRICVDFSKFNKTTKKDPYLLPFSNEVLKIVARYEAYSYLDGYSKYQQIFIALEDRYITTFVTNWGAFVWMVMSFRVKNGPPTLQIVVIRTF